MQEKYSGENFEQGGVPDRPEEDEESGGGERSAFKLSEIIEHMPYPAAKEDIIDFASDQGAEEEILDMLEQLPDTSFNSPADVSQALGESSDG